MANMPVTQGILETAIYVKDLQTTADFYRRLFGFGLLLETERLIALNVAGRSVLLLFKEGSTGAPFVTPGGTIPGHAGAGPTHFAFAIRPEDLEGWRGHLQGAGVGIESTVTWPGGAVSVYFRDTDQNLVELITPGFWELEGKGNDKA